MAAISFREAREELSAGVALGESPEGRKCWLEASGHLGEEQPRRRDG